MNCFQIAKDEAVVEGVFFVRREGDIATAAVGSARKILDLMKDSLGKRLTGGWKNLKGMGQLVVVVVVLGRRRRETDMVVTVLVIGNILE